MSKVLCSIFSLLYNSKRNSLLSTFNKITDVNKEETKKVRLEEETNLTRIKRCGQNWKPSNIPVSFEVLKEKKCFCDRLTVKKCLKIQLYWNSLISNSEVLPENVPQTGPIWLSHKKNYLKKTHTHTQAIWNYNLKKWEAGMRFKEIQSKDLF